MGDRKRMWRSRETFRNKHKARRGVLLARRRMAREKRRRGTEKKQKGAERVWASFLENRYPLKVYPENSAGRKLVCSTRRQMRPQATGKRFLYPRVKQNKANCDGGCLMPTSEDQGPGSHLSLPYRMMWQCRRPQNFQMSVFTLFTILAVSIWFQNRVWLGFGKSGTHKDHVHLSVHNCDWDSYWKDARLREQPREKTTADQVKDVEWSSCPSRERSRWCQMLFRRQDWQCLLNTGSGLRRERNPGIS